MKTIASANYWQKKQWDEALLMRDVEDERSRLTPDEKEERDRLTRESCARYLQKAEKILGERQKIPSSIRKWLFMRKVKQSTAVAQYFEVDMKAECDEHIGIIAFVAGEVLSDVIWPEDRANRRRMLKLLNCASSISVDVTEEYDRALQIKLFYSLSRVVTKKKWFKVSSSADSCPE